MTTSLPDTNKVVYFTGPRTVEVAEEPVKTPKAGEVAVRMRYSGISAGTELTNYRGDGPFWRGRQDPTTGLFDHRDGPQFAYPLTSGYAGVGVVHSVGPGVTSRHPGQLVAVFAPHQSWVCTNAAGTTLLPDLQDIRTGVLLANLNTALTGVLDARVSLGDVVVVYGLGIVGQLLIQLMKRSGVGLVIGVGRRRFRRVVAVESGADIVLEACETVPEEVRKLTGGRGADIAVEASGAGPALGNAIRAVGAGGRVITMSWYAKPVLVDLSAEFHHLRVQVKSSQIGSINPELGPMWSLGRRNAVATELLRHLRLSRLITHLTPVERAAEAFAAIDRGEEGLLQSVLQYE